MAVSNSANNQSSNSANNQSSGAANNQSSDSANTSASSEDAAPTNESAGNPVERQPILFIGGLGRSGTTLIEKLLNELPQTQSVGETVHLWERGVRDQERCGCGEAFAACSHWNAVGVEAFGSWANVDLDRVIDLRWKADRSRMLPQIFKALKTGKIGDEQREYLDFLRPVLLASAKVAGPNPDGGPKVILDSSKHLSTAAMLALDPALDVRVLHVLRDPRGVAYSWTKEIARPEAAITSAETSSDAADSSDGPGSSDADVGALMPTYKPSRTALRWVTDNLGFEALGKLGVPLLPLRYEDFLLDPKGSMTAAANFAGIAGDNLFPMIDGKSVRLSEQMHSVAGNPLRFGGDDITLRLDDAWKTKLDPAAKTTVTRITRPVLGHFGYKA